MMTVTKKKGKSKSTKGRSPNDGRPHTHALPPKPSYTSLKKSGRELMPESLDRVPNPVRKSHRELVERLCMDGVLPLEVMVGNMRFAHGQAHMILNKLITRLNENAPLNDEEKVVAVDDYRESLRWREAAQACARDAAPYLHPRLATIEIKDDNVKTITMVRRVIIDAGADAGDDFGHAGAEEARTVP